MKQLVLTAFATLLCMLSLALSSFLIGQTPLLERKAGERMALTIKNVEYAFRWCPAGTFMMGDEKNQRQITLSHGFWMQETEVTQEMWTGVMRHNQSAFKGLNRPVERVSWEVCQDYIKKLNNLGIAPKGYKFVLPTEAQWEYACRAGTTTAYYFGNTLSKEQANFDNSPDGQTREVGSYPANAWGLRDMHGNVSEWCRDLYGNYPTRSLMGGEHWVVRGGSWASSAENCRSANRSGSETTSRYSHIGFRLAIVSE